MPEGSIWKAKLKKEKSERGGSYLVSYPNYR